MNMLHEDACTALWAIPVPSDRDTWHRVISAFKSAVGDSGRSECDAWCQSAGDGKYNAANFRATWRSTSEFGGVTGATLVFLAKQNGWRGRPPLREPAAVAREHHKRKDAQARQLRCDERQQTKDFARFAALMSQTIPAPTDHPYLVAKGISAEGFAILPSKPNTLLIPMTDRSHRIVGIQAISETGQKKFIHASKPTLGSFVYGDIAQASTVYFAEGMATGQSVANSCPERAVIVVFAVGFFKSALSRYQDISGKRVIIADNDEAGLAVAQTLMASQGTPFAVPVLGKAKADFNDVYCAHGPMGVADQIKKHTISIDATTYQDAVHFCAEVTASPDPSMRQYHDKFSATIQQHRFFYGG